MGFLEELYDDSKNIVKGLQAFDKWLIRFELILSMFLLFSMIGISLYMILQQNFLKSDVTSWMDHILKMMVLWLGLLGASMATHYSHHISIEAIPRLVSPSLKRWIGVVVNIFSATVAYFLCVAAFSYVQSEFFTWLKASADIGFQSTYSIPPLSLTFEKWHVCIILPLVFLIFTFRFSLNALAHIYDLPLVSMEKKKKLNPTEGI